MFSLKWTNIATGQKMTEANYNIWKEDLMPNKKKKNKKKNLKKKKKRKKAKAKKKR